MNEQKKLSGAVRCVLCDESINASELVVLNKSIFGTPVHYACHREVPLYLARRAGIVNTGRYTFWVIINMLVVVGIVALAIGVFGRFPPTAPSDFQVQFEASMQSAKAIGECNDLSGREKSDCIARAVSQLDKHDAEGRRVAWQKANKDPHPNQVLLAWMTIPFLILPIQRLMSWLIHERRVNPT